MKKTEEIYAILFRELFSYKQLVDNVIPALDINGDYSKEIDINPAYTFDLARKQNKLMSLFEELYELSIRTNFYWNYCTLDTYQATLNNRLKEFLSNPANKATSFFNQDMASLGIDFTFGKAAATIPHDETKPLYIRILMLYDVDLSKILLPNFFDELYSIQDSKSKFIFEIIEFSKITPLFFNDYFASIDKTHKLEDPLIILDLFINKCNLYLEFSNGFSCFSAKHTKIDFLKNIKQNLIDDINYLFKTLQYKSKSENYYWEYCPLSTYTHTYDFRKDKFFNNIFDATEKDFVESELLDLDPSKDRSSLKLLESYNFLNMHDFSIISQNIETSTKRKADFLNKKLDVLINKSLSSEHKDDIIEQDDNPASIMNNSTKSLDDTNESLTVQASNTFPKIFSDDGFELFMKLKKHYIADSKSKLKIKYIEIWHYINDLELNISGKYILCNQKEYIAFVYDEFNVSISKITPKTTIYNDRIFKKLDQIRTIGSN